MARQAVRQGRVVFKEPFFKCATAIRLGGCSARGGDLGAGSGDVLIRFDRKDKARMDTFIHRAQHRQFDYVVAVARTIEGGFVVYDLIARKDVPVALKVDDTRDAYNSREVTTYECGNVDWARSDRAWHVRISSCTGPGKEGTVLSFD